MAVSERETADILSSFTLLVFLFKFFHRSFPAAAVILYGDCRRAQEGRDEERPENAVSVSRTDAQQVGKGDPGKGAELGRDHRHNRLSGAAHGIDKAAVRPVEQALESGLELFLEFLFSFSSNRAMVLVSSLMVFCIDAIWSMNLLLSETLCEVHLT